MFLILEVIGPLAAALGSAARYVFDEKGGTIGRKPECTWVIPDPHVSGQHAVISFHDGTFLIEDTSRNGIFINTPENRIPHHTPVAITSGDMIFVEPHDVRARIVSKLSEAGEGWSSLSLEYERAKVADAVKRGRDAFRLGIPDSALAKLRHLEARDMLAGSLKSIPDAPSAQRPAGEPSLSPAHGTVREKPSLTVAAARFAVYAPPRMRGGQHGVLEVWAYRPELHEDVAKEAMRGGRVELLASKGPISIEVGRTLTVTILEGHLRKALRRIRWRRRVGKDPLSPWIA